MIKHYNAVGGNPHVKFRAIDAKFLRFCKSRE